MAWCVPVSLRVRERVFVHITSQDTFAARFTAWHPGRPSSLPGEGSPGRRGSRSAAPGRGTGGGERGPSKLLGRPGEGWGGPTPCLPAPGGKGRGGGAGAGPARPRLLPAGSEERERPLPSTAPRGLAPVTSRPPRLRSEGKRSQHAFPSRLPLPPDFGLAGLPPCSPRRGAEGSPPGGGARAPGPSLLSPRAGERQGAAGPVPGQGSPQRAPGVGGGERLPRPSLTLDRSLSRKRSGPPSKEPLPCAQPPHRTGIPPLPASSEGSLCPRRSAPAPSPRPLTPALSLKLSQHE